MHRVCRSPAQACVALVSGSLVNHAPYDQCDARPAWPGIAATYLQPVVSAAAWESIPG
ncbi:MAG: hypothetical protein H6640_02920 [Caldilineaceae bacterium]|nr:hypothetical protein [Caldilineaceae bacterium]